MPLPHSGRSGSDTPATTVIRTPTPTVQAIIVTFNSEDHIESCIRALVDSGIHRILVWDNASSDATASLASGAYSSARIVCSESNLGFARAVNVAASECGPSDFLLLINPDCRATRRTLARLEDMLCSNPQIGAVAPAMICGDGRRGISGGGQPTLAKEVAAILRVERLVPLHLVHKLGKAFHMERRRLMQYMETSEPGPPIQVDWVSGFCLMVRRDAWIEAGGFDERFFMYFEDVDFGKRLSDRGWLSYCVRDVAATHYESSSSLKVGKNRMYRASLCQYFQLHGNLAQRLAAQVLGLAGS